MEKSDPKVKTLGIKSEIPSKVKPMLCSLIKEPFENPKYLFEVKWDGYRIIAFKNKKLVKLKSRSDLDYTKKYPAVATSLADLKHDFVLDGEVVVLNSEGRPDFDALQKFNGKQVGAYFYAFDLLWLDGKNLMKLPLIERKEILRQLIVNNPLTRFSEHFEDGVRLFEQIQSLKLEGIVAKKMDSHYQPGIRGTDWFKIPTAIRQEFVLGGWIESESRHFRTLLFGAYEGKKLMWIGHAGGGYKDREMPVILKKLKQLEIKTSPFENTVDYDGVAHWVKPILVANIRYATFTQSGKIRKPAIFEGFREDKPADTIGVEKPADVKDIIESEDRPINNKKSATSNGSNWPEIDRQTVRNKETFRIGECSLTLTNVDKEIWKNITKADLIEYYSSVSQAILAHLNDRPLSLHIKIKGPYAPGLYIKDMEDRQPDCGDIFSVKRKHKKTGKRNIIDYLVCNNLPTLLYTINLGCIDVNPWTSTTKRPDTPDFIVIDLDPSDGDFSKAVESAKAAKQFFDEYRVKAFIKTSGKTGMHLFIPATAFNFSQSRIIAENICGEIHSLMPRITTTEVGIANRGTKLYLDPNQNDYADTVAVVYSVRPFKHPYVSMPIEWKELSANLAPENFTIKNAGERLKKKGDLFQSVLDRTIGAKNDKILTRFL
jgi:bifunctional non-homologous end joining protein LigD